MKSLIAASLAGIALAQEGPTGRFGFADIQNMIQSMGASGDAAIQLAQQFQALSGFERSLVSNQPEALAGFAQIGAGYGCWCYFGDDHLDRSAKGPTLDAYDEACNKLSRGYECAIKDGEARSETCLPWNTQYEQVTTVVGQDHLDLCTTANSGNGQCSIDACAIESLYVSLFQDLRNNQNLAFTDEFKHDNAAWPAIEAAMCVGPSGGDNADIQCCGAVPTRYPFNVNSPVKECCENTQIFNNVFFTCCNDGQGTVVGTGESCP